MIDPKAFRARAIRDLTDQIGVYALCDLDGVPIYVGQSVDGIRSRVRCHLTSARSDIIANRMIDVWEIAYVMAWPVADRAMVPAVEASLYARFDAQRQLMNGRDMGGIQDLFVDLPDPQLVQVIAEDERRDRLRPAQRLPRQIAQYLALVDYIQTVKDEPHLKRALRAHFDRLVRYHAVFLT